jgi:TRAP-type C4-dicarboxylate transport system substrate-binding protein
VSRALAYALVCEILAALAIVLAATPARADGKQQWRFATVAPDGSAYARELRWFAREIEDATSGDVTIKWYWGGIAGDDAQLVDRVHRGQIDGFASGMICQLVSPSFRALHVPGLYHSRDEVRFAATRLWSELAGEFKGAGLELLGFATLGPVEVFSRHPVRSLADLKRERMWVWDSDLMLREPLREIGLDMVSLPIWEAGRAYAESRTDGFFTIPTGTLLFQWYTQAHYMTVLDVNYLTGCVAITSRAFDRLSTEQQQTVRGAAAKFASRLEQINTEQDRLLLGGFQKQGVTRVEVTETFREELQQALRGAIERLGPKLVSVELRRRVEALLAEHRAKHVQP